MIGDLVNAINVGVCIFAAVGIVLLYRNYRVDKLRDDIFALRDELFVYAATEGLLDHPGYRDLRAMMNGMLRFSHKLSVPRLTLLMVLEKMFVPLRERVNPSRAWINTLHDMPSEKRNKVMRYHEEMTIAVMKFLVGGVLCNPIAGCIVVFMFAHRGFRHVGESLYMILAKRGTGMRLLEEQALRSLR